MYADTNLGLRTVYFNCIKDSLQYLEMMTGKLEDKLCLTRRQSEVYIARKEKGEIRDGFRNMKEIGRE